MWLVCMWLRCCRGVEVCNCFSWKGLFVKFYCKWRLVATLTLVTIMKRRVRLGLSMKYKCYAW